MKLQTQISLQPERDQIDYSSTVLLMGSCFVENIGEKLSYYKFQNLLNSFGIIFHPVAIEQLVTRAINEDEFTDADIFYHNERWHCFEVHSSKSASDASDFLNKLNELLKELHHYLKTATHIVFTYGTAWIYRCIESDSIVANCHKIPQKKFLKELLSVEEVSEAIDNAITLIRDINPNILVILTVSPVRHLKDGFVENTRSKANLITGIHEIVAPNNKIHYFPSYEIMMDELRDYRFYAEDMLHPNATAISLIWDKFNEVWIASETVALQKEIESIQAGLSHRSFNENSEAHRDFKQKLQHRIQALQIKLPYISF